MAADAVPPGTYTVWADDDDVIGLTVARTHPQGLVLVRTDPPIMDAFDEYGVADFLAWCLTNASQLTLTPSEPHLPSDGETDLDWWENRGGPE